VAVMLIARFAGDIDQLRRAYDRAHALIMSRGGATGVGELRHHCAIGEGALYIIGVWESEERVRTRWASEELEDVLTSLGFPSPKTAETTILELHATDPPFKPTPNTEASPITAARFIRALEVVKDPRQAAADAHAMAVQSASSWPPSEGG
jgi:hypothetical protein